MFTPKTEHLRTLASQQPSKIARLEELLASKTNIYIDYANVLGWQDRLGWHVELKRLKQLLSSFDTVKTVKLYYGTLSGDEQSQHRLKEIARLGYDLHTKPVKLMRLPVDVSSVSSQSTDILKNFIRKPLLKKLKVETVEYLNNQLRELNSQGILFLEERKCNFDVEIGRDMLLDYGHDDVDTFILWSGDSDFADPIRQLLADGKSVFLFATARRVATELSELKSAGLYIYDIQNLRDFICRKKEMVLNAKGTPEGAPKL